MVQLSYCARQQASGFTLVELLIVVVLLGILGTLGANMISDSFTTSQTVNTEQSNTGSARYIAERLAREMREIKYTNTSSTTPCPGDSVASNKYCISTMTTSPPALTFTRNDNVTVSITYSGSTLTLAHGSTSNPLSSNVSAFTLDFLDQSSSNTSVTASNVKFIVFTLTVTNSGQSIQQRTRVALRNSL